MIQIIEKIEGEAKLHFHYEKGKINHTNIEFATSRHIENILKNKLATDALVINPRVCGICGHAHLLATVNALESIYPNNEISNKAKTIREITLNLELIQNHFKWLYLVVYPLLDLPQDLKKVVHSSQIVSKAIATVAGQYPHNSYALIGGITSEILPIDLINLNHLLDEILAFYVNNIANVELDNFLSCENIENVENKQGDLPTIMKLMKERDFEKIGKSFDRFIVFGENSYFKSGRAQATRVSENLNLEEIKEEINQNSFAKNVTYKDKYYEVGPLARGMIKKTPLIKDAHRRYTDSVFSRISARVCEIAQLTVHCKKLLKHIDLNEPSFIKPKISLQDLSGIGISCVEAARGSLIHKVELKNGIIQEYQIITPTQWNLSNGTPLKQGVAQFAINGVQDNKTAELVFKSFDVCSVCTTH